jgi:quercetin dioxygenase-like cupin family protein
MALVNGRPARETPNSHGTQHPRRTHVCRTCLPALDAHLLAFDLGAEVAQLRQEIAWGREAGRSSKTLVKYPDLRIVLVLMKSHSVMRRHKVAARISIQALEGRLRLHLPDRVLDLPAGTLLTLDCCEPHDVEAQEESAFLLSISWHGRAARSIASKRVHMGAGAACAAAAAVA